MILEQIEIRTKERINEKKKKVPLHEIRAFAESMQITMQFPFRAALQKEGIHFICEVKKASPSKGIIAEHFPYLEIAKEYEQAGAAAVSVLTEPYFFLGKDEYLSEIVSQISIPVLRKDFTVDDYMIYEAKGMGASAILLICSILEKGQMKEYLQISKSLGLSVLVEAHDEAEVSMALDCGADIIGVNNRNLKTFEVDIRNAIKLRTLVPREIVFVSESGISTPSDIKLLRENGTNAVLVGEALMKSKNKLAFLQELRGE